MNSRKHPTMNKPKHRRVRKYFDHAEGGEDGASVWSLIVLSNEDRSKASAQRIGWYEAL